MFWNCNVKIKSLQQTWLWSYQAFLRSTYRHAINTHTHTYRGVVWWSSHWLVKREVSGSISVAHKIFKNDFSAFICYIMFLPTLKEQPTRKEWGIFAKSCPADGSLWNGPIHRDLQTAISSQGDGLSTSDRRRMKRDKVRGKQNRPKNLPSSLSLWESRSLIGSSGSQVAKWTYSIILLKLFKICI